MTITRNYEDEYTAEEFATFERMASAFTFYAEHEFYGHLNVPVWLEHEDGTLKVGVMLTRKGHAMQWICPATDEQAHEIRQRMLRIWAQRADTGFSRFTVERVHS